MENLFDRILSRCYVLNKSSHRLGHSHNESLRTSNTIGAKLKNKSQKHEKILTLIFHIKK